MKDDWHDRIQRYIDGKLSDEEAKRLQAELLRDEDLALLYLRHTNLDVALEARAELEEIGFGLDVDRSARKARASRRFNWAPLSAAAGLMLGGFSASLVWAISTPKVISERIFALADGNFESGAGIGAGFPKHPGTWSGDAAEAVAGKLHFVEPGSDSGDPSGRSISCDVFQIIDLRPLREAKRFGTADVLELSSAFLDDRPPNTNPSVTCFCQIYLFSGDWAGLGALWPKPIAEALCSGSAQTTTMGRSRDGKGWRTLTAKCFLPEAADYAVVQIAARPNLRPATLEGIFADDVQLTLKTSPELPIRTVTH